MVRASEISSPSGTSHLGVKMCIHMVQRINLSLHPTQGRGYFTTPNKLSSAIERPIQNITSNFVTFEKRMITKAKFCMLLQMRIGQSISLELLFGIELKFGTQTLLGSLSQNLKKITKTHCKIIMTLY